MKRPDQKWTAALAPAAGFNQGSHLRHPGDILVDDYLKYQHLREEAGGIFVHHTSADETIDHLASLGLSVHKP